MTAIAQRSFSGGEVAPSLYARTDQVKYATGLRTCRNSLIMRHGGASNRPGTKFVGEARHSDETIRLLPFIFNADQTYILEFGNLYMRVIRNGAQVTETAKAITGVTQANPGVVTSVAHGFSVGDEVFITGIVGMTELNGRNFLIAGVTADTFTLTDLQGGVITTTAFTAYVSAGSVARIYQIVTPYLMADLPLLKFVQSADVITIVHHSYAPRELSRTGHTSWTLSTITFEPGISAPTGVTNTGPAGSTTKWKVTAVAAESFEESVPSSETGSSAVPTSTSGVGVLWTAVTGATEYNIYKAVAGNSQFGFIGVATTNSFTDDGIEPDFTATPPIPRNPFGSAGNYPACVTYFQQRLMLGNTDNAPETIFGSRSANLKNFTVSSPLQDDDAITFGMAGRQVNSIKHLLDLGQLLVLTAGGESAVGGDQSGILRPGQINPKQHSYNGSSDLTPIILSGSALYVQARGGIVRDIGFDFTIDGYRGNDMTVFSAHLFDGFTLVDWSYQQIPNSIVWTVRNDGILLGLTYVREQQVLAWHRHDFDGGTVENVCCVPEGTEDAVYVVVKRTIHGVTRRYIERFASRLITNILDAVFMDSALSYDGRNSNNLHSMLMSGGTTWEYTETLTLTSSLPFFLSTDVGNAIHMVGPDGTLIRFAITGYTSATVVTGTPHTTVPTAMRSLTITNWSHAVDRVSGLWHLEGQQVSVLGDGLVVASPNNAAYDVRSVSGGVVVLDKPYAVIHVGLPYLSDVETLDIDTPQGETVADKKKLISAVTMFVEASRGIFAGPHPPTDDDTDPLENLIEAKLRNDEDYNDPIALKTDNITINIQGQLNTNGRVFIRQVDPLPLSILSVVPAGLVPFRG